MNLDVMPSEYGDSFHIYMATRREKDSLLKNNLKITSFSLSHTYYSSNLA
jgi:hypothetical protein